jgi:hypothetical protein
MHQGLPPANKFHTPEQQKDYDGTTLTISFYDTSRWLMPA